MKFPEQGVDSKYFQNCFPPNLLKRKRVCNIIFNVYDKKIYICTQPFHDHDLIIEKQVVSFSKEYLFTRLSI